MPHLAEKQMLKKDIETFLDRGLTSSQHTNKHKKTLKIKLKLNFNAQFAYL